MKKITLFTFICFLASTFCFAQLKEPTIKMTFGKGILFTSADSTFTLGISGRIQSLFINTTNLEDNENMSDFLVRRARLNFQGTAFNPRFTYRMQLGFSLADMNSANIAVPNTLVLRDAMLFYKATDWLRLGFGQTKLPGNRERLVSSANLQLVDRSIVNTFFTLDRDKGFWFYMKFKAKNMVIKPTLAISSGEGRIAADKNGKLSYSGRFEFLPFGDFTHDGDNIQSDIENEQKPKFSIAGVYNYNIETPRTMGQLGDYLWNAETSNIQYYGADLLFKYKGFAFESSLYSRTSDNEGIIVDKKDPLKKNFVITGTGFSVQSGYIFNKRNEIAARYAQILPSAAINTIFLKQQDYTVGYNYFFNKHSLKLQNDLTYSVNGPTDYLIYRLTAIVTF